MNKKQVHIIGGGTVMHVRSHLALAAPAYGTTAKRLAEVCQEYAKDYDIQLHLTRMANSGRGNLETNSDIADLVNNLLKDTSTKMIFFNPAMIDYEGTILTQDGRPIGSGKYASRLSTRKKPQATMELTAAAKVISTIRRERKDIYLIGFKETCGDTQDKQYIAGLELLKEASANLILANDTRTRSNMIITPEEARYHVTTDREEALQNLVEIAFLRSQMTYTRTIVNPGDPIPWEDAPVNFRTVVEYCIQNGAYKAFNGKTVGHFSVKLDGNTVLISRRGQNFNEIRQVGIVKVALEGEKMIAEGSKPSAGARTQYVIYSQHPEYDSIVHFHCPLKEGSAIPIVPQRPYECGSHECGHNTSSGLQKFGSLSAVYLDQHGPNIVFNSTQTDPEEVIHFIESNFDLNQKTGGPVSLP